MPEEWNWKGGKQMSMLVKYGVRINIAGRFGAEWVGLSLLLIGVQSNLVCVSNLGLWSNPEDQPSIIKSYDIGSGTCDGTPPIAFTPDCWNGVLPHPCTTPRIFDKIAMIACQARDYSNPKACQYVGYVLRKGICVTAPFKGGSSSLTLDCGPPRYWGWERVLSPTQLKPGWQGTCILKIEPFEFGATRTRQGKGKMRKARGLEDHVGRGPCVPCLSEDGTAIRMRSGIPNSCEWFDLTTCVFGSDRPMVVYRCNGTEGVLCYDPRRRGMSLEEALKNRGKRITTTLTPALHTRSASPSTTAMVPVIASPVVKPRGTIKTIDKEQCNPCIKTTIQGTLISKTLVYHTYKPDGCTPYTPPTCQVKTTVYHMCVLNGKVQCYNPTEAKVITTYEMSIYTTECGREELLNKTEFRSLGRQVELSFDACMAINRNCDVWKSTCGTLEWERSYMLDKKYMCRKQGECIDRDTYSYCPYWACAVMWTGGQPGGSQRCKLENGVARSNCQRNQCNPIKITCTPTKLWKEDYGLGIYAKGKDPLVTLRWYVTKTTRKLQDTKGLFWSFYLEMEKLNIPEIPKYVTNTFVKLAEDIAHTLNVSNCFVCGGTNMGEKWPWEAQELNYSKVLEMDQKGNLSYTKGKDGDWTLTTNLVGNVCFKRKIIKGCKEVGNLICIGKWESKVWWSGNNATEGIDEQALFNIEGLAFLNDPDNQTLGWLAPDGLYWICGKMAYGYLPKNWCGACVLGIIRPGSFSYL
ncbi:endogenous retrovirus group 3 member 1 Env polyprotein-like [Pantherophis guttatus]|uniref:Endogenous retrovirus group 3 member 1 Env polyprotein-like n=1 Tax=Pantherophis guttatus TaxID=94885 RepID=A0ABM3YP20_PANGU|nr:endogenous retrovirus group 3 member 1 Env polyprotein-like [Pantherophis guttatus]XP_060537873.1 endogenous retrovirus group 3 member 1 Env polyprotein-like [Pantherophis guttatus]XP_060537874.1 endogenous retrovirus group 3 member 1 Env polyprotein-like [Pantherophis guttatus]XP_060537876.1 endogenous retrovirus group 3 member 1 Env polyprotein-like [Pantherophis guttatus]